ncbi:MAG: hypothetical protein LBD03_05545, partial [Methanobrevibacter sp.]|nr:hypothetical protein [Candidatus Methanovirga procula]
MKKNKNEHFDSLFYDLVRDIDETILPYDKIGNTSEKSEKEFILDSTLSENLLSDHNISLDTFFLSVVMFT